MRTSRLLLILSLGICLIGVCSCTNGKIKPEPLSGSQYYADSDYGEFIEIPFRKQGGVRTIQVKINDCAEFPMIFDTGCSGMSISVLELATLIKNGYITEDDLVGTTQAQIADGSVISEAVVNLKKLKIGDYECHNVHASISENSNAPLLLGNGALKDVKSFSVDDNAGVIKFYLK
ncbi:MAG: retroviral-like aspartic protease family protein [Paludibacteraceae bacterium]|nr:retroviral-like aspartic protease family protein [Paludibacteraceae bacterium]